MNRLVVMMVLTFLMASSALAQTDLQLPPKENAAIAAELTLWHQEFCLNAFPDDAAVEALAIHRQGVVMTPEQIGGRLHGESGKGWLLKDEHAVFAVMLETAQYHACSVSVTTEALLTPGPLYTILDSLYAGQKNMKIQPAVLSSNNSPAYYSATITNAVANADGGSSGHSFKLVKDYYRDTSKKLLRLDTRLVHQIGP